MRIAIDFDGTIVEQDGIEYEDVTTPLKFLPDAKEGLLALKAAGHQLLLWSARSSPRLFEDPVLDPWVRARGGMTSPALNAWASHRWLHIARRDQMLAFVAEHLPGVFDAIDDGHGGKPNADLFIDDKAMRFGGGGAHWREILETLGKAG